jgi:K+-sensing histidine kinase KdpD
VIGSAWLKVFPRQRRAECGGRRLDLTSTEFNLLEARNTPSGGQVHIAGNYEALRHEVRLMIADEGPGLGGPELASMFEPFFRGQATNTTSGHGLGLAITHRVIQSHGGRVSASNRATGGLAVEISLPA